jgi:glycerol-3-phosphate O-acyltransferase / dihydroxyacetone phosphate acyltransferase
MWLYRRLHGTVRFAARTYYRVTVAGERVPGEGSVLLVANHPNSLMDGAMMASASPRPVRFLARAPLFQLTGVAWLIRGMGAIPVYRRDDDPDKVARNEEMFSAVHGVLADGAVVGMFPEGLSHSGPSLAPLKTGAARIALGARQEIGHTFPILPVGLTFRGGKDRFRSEALVLVGRPVQWDDLVADDPSRTREPVRELTKRIHDALSRVTVNLGTWADFPLIEGAEAIHDAELERRRSSDRSGASVRWLVRMRRTAEALEEARAGRNPKLDPLARDIARHMRVLNTLGLRPADLRELPRTAVALRWTVRNLVFFCLALPLAALGMVVFLLPHQLVQRFEPRFDLPPDRRATYRVIAEAVAGGGWVLLLASALREFVGWQPALWALAGLPLLGLITLRIRHRWRDAVADLRRILLLRGRRDLRARLLDRQAELAARIRELHQEVERRPPADPSGPVATQPRSGEQAGREARG